MTQLNPVYPDSAPRFETPNLAAAPNALERLLEALQPDSALLLVRCSAPCAEAWLTDARLSRCIAAALLGPTGVEITALAPDTHSIRLRFPSGCGTPMRSLELHTLRQQFEKLLAGEWAAESSQPIPLSVTPFAPLSHLENMRDNIDALNSLLDIIVNQQLRPQFQPIVNLRDGKSFGYETLIRGPKDALLRRPGQMFRVADMARIVAWFDLACMEECLKLAAQMEIRHKLFLNMDAEGLASMSLQERPLGLRARELGISPSSIVIEVTERQTMTEFPRFIEELDALREQGFQIAIDDAGAGYSSLRTVAEIRPEFVKIDRDLVKSIDTCRERRALLSALTQYASSVGASVVAEGVETREELAALIDLGIPYAQGYIFGKPTDALRGTPREIREFVQSRVESRELQQTGSDVEAGKIAHPGLAMPLETPLGEAARRLVKDPGLTSVVVVDDDRPVGLVTRAQLDHVLSAAKAAQAAEMMPAETVAQWMRTDFLTASATAPVRDVSQAIITRQSISLDADVVILDGAGVYVGVLPVRTLMDAASNRAPRAARYADPLTGLPGRVKLEQAVIERVEDRRSLGVIRVDLSDLAIINEKMGLARGDDLILALAEILRGASLRHGGPDDLVAHLGGDNFVILTGAERAQEVCEEIVRSYARTAPRFVAEHAASSGARVVPPAMCTISVAAVTNRTRRFSSMDRLMASLAELMRAARSTPGNRYLLDRP